MIRTLGDAVAHQSIPHGASGGTIMQYTFRIDNIFRDVCVPNSISLSSVVPSQPCTIGGCIEGDCIVVQIADTPKSSLGDLKLVLKITGIREGREHVRFPKFSKKEWELNTKFWAQAATGPP